MTLYPSAAQTEALRQNAGDLRPILIGYAEIVSLWNSADGDDLLATYYLVQRLIIRLSMGSPNRCNQSAYRNAKERIAALMRLAELLLSQLGLGGTISAGVLDLGLDTDEPEWSTL